MRTRTTLLIVVLILFGALNPINVPVTRASEAASWNLARDFCASRNPCGAWEYGFSNGSFQRFSSAGTSSWNGVPVWSNGGETAPLIWKNTSSQSGFGVAPGQVSLHPGPNSEAAVVRWNPPGQMFVRMDISFQAGDSAALDFSIQQGSVQLYHTRSAEDVNLSFVTAIDAQKDAWDFVVSGGYANGNTPLEVQITQIDSMDLAADFDPMHNPAGSLVMKDLGLARGWEYGWKDSVKGTFTPFSWSGPSSWNGVPIWSNSGETAPMVWKNTSSQTGFGVNPGEVALHPGPNGEYAVVRWKSPYIWDARVDVTFGAGDGAELDYYILADGQELFHERSAETRSFSFIWSIRDSTIEFLVGGGYTSGTTPLSVHISPSSGWNLADDFDALHNLSGTWTYGWKDSFDGTFTPFSWSGPSSWNGVPIWSNSGETAPMVWKNTSSQTGFGVNPGEVALHPGPNGEYTAVRWTPPHSMPVWLHASFQAGDTAVLDYYIRRNSAILFHQRSGETKVFAANVWVNAGETLEFSVGGGYTNGNTPVQVFIWEEQWDY